jgi:hypothetical protein
MSTLNSQFGRTRNNELEQVIEPLASYICATDQPRVALISALAVLVSAVKETNKAARIHFRNFSEVQWS